MIKKSLWSMGLVLLLLSGCKSLMPPTARVNNSAASLAEVSRAVSPVQNVFLLVPLQGSLGNSGQAVRDGFLTAYNSESPDQRPAHVNIIDTSTIGAQQAYQEAVTQGADFIVGPLTKTDVQSIASGWRLSVPTLALNYLDPNQSAPGNLYQFGLSPLDEVNAAVSLAWQQGLRNALVIAPEGSWGKNMSEAFQSAWQGQGGGVVDTLLYSSSSGTLSKQMQSFLRFQQNGKKGVPTHRKDFDVIFLAASPNMARQIRPLLKFYYVGEVPVFATSLIYTGAVNASADVDLDGVTFCDAPWALGARGPFYNLKQRLSVFWPGNFQQNARLYGLGVDAYFAMEQLDNLSGQSLMGATGTLHLDSQNRMVRDLTCAEFHGGVPGMQG